jgi:AcrR family transcriptional regulator
VVATRSRREEYSEASRHALLDSARRLFAARGFTATSLDEIAADARLTKGAVYHHFANKQSLFQAVLTPLESETVAAISEASAEARASAASPWEAALAGLDAFLARCLDPVYQRICFLEGPLALGFMCWWEMGERNEIGLIRGLLSDLHGDGLIATDDVDMLTLLVFGSLIAAALDIARSTEPAATRDRVRAAVARMIWGLRPPAASSAPPASAPPASAPPASAPPASAPPASAPAAPDVGNEARQMHGDSEDQ